MLFSVAFFSLAKYTSNNNIVQKRSNKWGRSSKSRYPISRFLGLLWLTFLTGAVCHSFILDLCYKSFFASLLCLSTTFMRWDAHVHHMCYFFAPCCRDAEQCRCQLLLTEFYSNAEMSNAMVGKKSLKI